MQIVIEYSLLTGFVANYLSLALSEKILKFRGRLKWLSAILGSVVSLVSPLFCVPPLLRAILLVFVLILAVLVSFRYTRFAAFVRNWAVVLLITCLFGGVNEALSSFLGQLPLLAVNGVLLVTYIASRVVCSSIDKRNKVRQFSFSLKIVDGEKCLEEEGYLDSGNVLQDSITKKPIILINFEVFHKLYENVSRLNALTKNYDFRSFKDGHFVDINSVGGGGKILVFSVDEVQVGQERSFKNAMLGLSFSGFEKSFGKNVLLNRGLI